MDFSMNTEGANAEGMDTGKNYLFSEKLHNFGERFLGNNTDSQNENQQDHTNQQKPAMVAKSGDLKGRLVGLNLDPMEAKSDENLKQSKKIKADWDCFWAGKNKNAEPQSSMSDENLKEVNPDIDILDDYSKIDAYAYRYNNKAHQLYGNEKGVDNELHVGPMAQELASTKSTKAAVSRDTNGYEEVDVRKLTLSNTAAISELVRKVESLEKMLGGKHDKQ